VTKQKDELLEEIKELKENAAQLSQKEHNYKSQLILLKEQLQA